MSNASTVLVPKWSLLNCFRRSLAVRLLALALALSLAWLATSPAAIAVPTHQSGDATAQHRLHQERCNDLGSFLGPHASTFPKKQPDTQGAANGHCCVSAAPALVYADSSGGPATPHLLVGAVVPVSWPPPPASRPYRPPRFASAQYI